MNESAERSDGAAVSLSGHQVKYIRIFMGESQDVFSRRFAVSKQTVSRLEAKGNELCRGPEIILIDQLARQNGVTIPENLPWSDRPEAAEA